MKDKLVASSLLAWVHLNKFVTENQSKIEFNDHRFLVDPMNDRADDIVGRKSAQVGWSVSEILRSFHEAKFGKRNIAYILPTMNVINDFVKPKVNPLIASNPLIAQYVHDDSIELKKVGDRFIYFKGAFSQTSAISFSVDTLVLDEYDRMSNMSVVNIFDSRLFASDHPKRRRFSNPSGIGYGVDALYQDSNQYHWFVTCSKCNHQWYMDWNQTEDDKAHFVDKDRIIYACGKCKSELSRENRRMGRWVAKYPDRPRHGYWFSQMMAPWVTAEHIVEQSSSNIEFFYNFVLGKAYTPSDLVVNRATILRACSPATIPKLNVAMGVDQKAGELEWVAGTTQGIFAHGKASSWEEIETLKLTWDATMVVDPAPYPTMPKKLAEKYTDFYLCYFKETTGLQIVDFNGQIVYADRTRLLDTVANEITDAKLLFRENPSALEDYIADWQNIYRTTVESPDGRTKSTWLKKDNKESDYPFATAYFRIALSTLIGTQSFMVEPQTTRDTPQSFDAGEDSLSEVIENTLSSME